MALAKKVFFLFPHSVIQETLVEILVQAEFEVSLLNDSAKARRMLDSFPSSIMFCNIDDRHFKEEEWVDYITEIIASRENHDARLGVLTYDPKPELAMKYLMDVGVQCGYIGLKLGLTESAKIILKTLEANEAKGGRRFVRIKCPPGKAIISIPSGTRFHNGKVLDLSSAGLACLFDEKVKINAGEVIPQVQLQLWGAILRVSLNVMGVRDQDGQQVFVMMFESFDDRTSKQKLHHFIRKALQSETDAFP